MLKITPLTPMIGAEIGAIDLSRPVADEEFATIKQALLKYQVIFFRNQTLSNEAFVAWGERFGPLMKHPAASKHHPDLDKLAVVRADETTRNAFGEGWHSDQSALPEPPTISMLYINTLPDVGGDTLWSSTYGAYDALSAPVKRLVNTLSVFHNNLKPNRGYVFTGSGRVMHFEQPLVIRHPDTQRCALFANRLATTHIPQLAWAESEALLAFLYAHIEQPRFQCRFRWSKNTVALWDNRCTQHTAVWDYFPQVREGVRLTVRGHALAAAFPEQVAWTDERPVAARLE